MVLHMILTAVEREREREREIQSTAHQDSSNGISYLSVSSKQHYRAVMGGPAVLVEEL